MRKRIFWLDFAKGATIFLVVVGHVFAAIFNNIAISNGIGTTIFKGIMYIIFLVIMPIFFALSGFLYRNVESIKDYGKLLGRKLISLGIPYTIFSILLVMLSIFFKLNVDGASSYKDILYITVRPIAYLWFLQSLFLAFAIVGLLSLLKMKPSLQIIILLCGTSIGMFVPDKQFYFYVIQSFSWALCFYLGYLIKCNKIILNGKLVLVSVGVMLLSIIWQIMADPEWYLRGDFFNVENTLGKLASIFVFLYVYQNVSTRSKWSQKFSSYGKESLIIYLIHVPVISVIRKILMEAGITNVIVIFFICLLGSWYLSVLASWIVTNVKPLDFIFYPLKYIKINR